MITVGIDVGSVAAKAAAYNGEEILATAFTYRVGVQKNPGTAFKRYNDKAQYYPK